MMIETLSEGTYTARKQHEDSSWLYIREWFSNVRPFVKTGLTIAELRELAKLKANNGKIMPGQVYKWQRNIYDCDFMTWKSLPAIEKICWKHEVYPTDDWY